MQISADFNRRQRRKRRVETNETMYLGEIKDSQKESRTKATEVFDPVLRQTRTWRFIQPIVPCPSMPPIMGGGPAQ
jgi:hypothetical protein